jgi:hypothetical protein
MLREEGSMRGPRCTLAQQQNWSSKLEQLFLSSIGPGGFEPPLTDPKSAVLPLDEGPSLQ